MSPFGALNGTYLYTSIFYFSRGKNITWLRLPYASSPYVLCHFIPTCIETKGLRLMHLQ